MRSIKQIYKSEKVNMGGILLEQPLPIQGIEQIDPFLLVHHWAMDMPGGQKQSAVGVGPHPHRGFAPVTFIFKGNLQHRDSEGNDDVVEAGGTQWMNSGKGIIHSERPTKELAEKGGVFEIIQFWVNAPAARKLDAPSYQPLTKEDTPVYTSPDGMVNVGVVAGDFNSVSGKIDTYSPLLILRLEMEANGEIELPIPENFNAFVYQLDGEMVINDSKSSGDKTLCWFENDGEHIHLKAKTKSRVILLAGAPINEPLKTYGPFVMNSQREIMDALQDYQMGKMGQLVEQFE